MVILLGLVVRVYDTGGPTLVSTVKISWSNVAGKSSCRTSTITPGPGTEVFSTWSPPPYETSIHLIIINDTLTTCTVVLTEHIIDI